MLVGASAPGQTVSYGYYPEGGRAWKQVNGVTSLYLEVDGVEWGSYDATGTLKERTIRASGAGGAVIATHSHAGLIRLLPNRQGSIIGWLRPDGKLGGAYTYDAYGNSPQAAAPGPQYRYAGMRFDAETGLYHTPFRAYDPVDGRWMQLDPIGIRDGLNRYAYVKNSPLNWIDSAGTDALWVTNTNTGEEKLIIPVKISGDGADPFVSQMIIDRFNSLDIPKDGPIIEAVLTDVPVEGVLNNLNFSSGYNFEMCPRGGECVDVLGGNKGHVNSDNGTSVDAGAHEIGHFAGMDDQYNEDKPKDGEMRGNITPKEGYDEKNIMVSRGGTELKREQLQEAKNNYSTKKCHAKTGTRIASC